MPVSCVTSGTNRGLNQFGTNRRTEMNVTASPRPTTARAAMAVGNDSVKASVSWPGRHQGGPSQDQRLGTVPVE